MLGLKQEALAFELGEDWNQKKVSLLEGKEVVDDGLLEQVAKVLKVPTDAIRNFDEEKAVNIISNTFHDTKGFINYNPSYNFNPIDKIVELYDALVKSEKEKVEMLQRMLEGKK